MKSASDPPMPPATQTCKRIESASNFSILTFARPSDKIVGGDYLHLGKGGIRQRHPSEAQE
jgi:hypothetical protein